MLKGVGKVGPKQRAATGQAWHGPAAALVVAYLLLSSAVAVWLSLPRW